MPPARPPPEPKAEEPKPEPPRAEGPVGEAQHAKVVVVHDPDRTVTVPSCAGVQQVR